MMVSSLVVTVVATPAAFDTWATPEARIPTMLLSVNLSVKFEFARISILPVLPRLITALEFAPDTIVAPERIVELETAAWPLTVTWPVTVISPAESFGMAKATVEYKHQTAATVISVMNCRILVLLSMCINVLLNQSLSIYFYNFNRRLKKTLFK